MFIYPPTYVTPWLLTYYNYILFLLVCARWRDLINFLTEKSGLQIGLVDCSLSESRFFISWWLCSFQLDPLMIHTDELIPPFTSIIRRTLIHSDEVSRKIFLLTWPKNKNYWILTELMEFVDLPNWMPLVGLANGNKLDGSTNVKEFDGLTNGKELANLRIGGVFITRFKVKKDGVPQEIGSISV